MLPVAGVPKTHTVTFSSILNASVEAVWEVVGTMHGVNAELAPWLRMTAPPETAGMRIDEAPLGQPLFTSWVLFGGVLPVDRHAFKLAEVNRGRGFVERSTSWSERAWEHRRLLEPRGERGCTLTDWLTFTPRVSVSGPIMNRVIGAVFGHRHRVLRQRFGGRAP